jgi:SAM-dependent methyltransferase
VGFAFGFTHPTLKPMPDAPPKYLAPYADAQRRLGNDVGVTLWASEASQRTRFDLIRQMVDLTGRTVLDAGCSRGDFAAYLHDRGISYARYIGVDGVPELIDYARDRDLPRTRFEAGDLVRDAGLMRTGDPEVVVISGTLNTMPPDIAMGVIESAWSATRDTLIFNWLSDRVGPDAPPQLPPAVRLPTMRFLEWALRQTWKLQYRQDYFPGGHDATIVMRRA